MKIAKYELEIIQKKQLVLTMEDDVDSEELLEIFLKSMKVNEENQGQILGVIAEKKQEERCTEQCENCQDRCPAGEV